MARKKTGEFAWLPTHCNRNGERIMFRPPGHKAMRIGAVGDSRPVVLANYRKVCDELGVSDDKKNMRLSEGFEFYKDRCERYSKYADRTKDDIDDAIAVVIAGMDDPLLSDIDAELFSNYLDDRKLVSRYRAQKERTYMMGLFTYLLSRGKVTANYPAQTEAITVEPRTRLVSLAEYSMMYHTVPVALRMACELALLCHMRRQDFCSLRMSNITERGIVYCESKTSKAILRPWTDRLRELVAMRDELPKSPDFVDEGWFIHQRNGGRFTVNAFKSAVYRWRMKMRDEGMKVDWTWHDLKSMGASAIDGDEEKVLDFTGHTNKGMLQHYRLTPVTRPTLELPKPTKADVTVLAAR